MAADAPKKSHDVRLVAEDDLPALAQVLDETQLFPSDMLPDMAAGFLNPAEHPGTQQSIWLTCERNGQPISLGYAVEEKLAEGAWNFLALAVLPYEQGRGVATAMLETLHQLLRQRQARILIVETSSADNYERAQRFYRRSGFVEEARIRDFWGQGEDKIVFWKAV